MTKLVLLAGLAGTIAACAPDTRNIDKKLDAIQAKLDNLEKKVGAGGGVAQPRAQRPEPDRSKTYSVPVDNDPFDGPADAKVTVVKAYDYQCPYCEKVRPAMDELRQKYGNDVRVVYKQL